MAFPTIIGAAGEVIREPRSMDELRRMCTELATSAHQMKTAFNTATAGTPSMAGIAARDMGAVPRSQQVMHRGESAISGALDAFSDLADALDNVYRELRNAGVPENASW